MATFFLSYVTTFIVAVVFLILLTLCLELNISCLWFVLIVLVLVLLLMWYLWLSCLHILLFKCMQTFRILSNVFCGAQYSRWMANNSFTKTTSLRWRPVDIFKITVSSME